MKHLARILRLRRTRALVVLSLASVAFFYVALDTARACWNYVVIECMDRPGTQWPWQAPPASGRAWKVCAVVNGTTYCSPSIPATVPRWHIHVGNYFDVLMCPDDDQSLWCYGYPVGNDPEFNTYPANYNTYVTYGRVNLSQAVSARVLWSMWSATEVMHDSVYWGASKTSQLTDAGMKIGGSTWEETNNGWERFTMDLDSLHDFVTGEPFSFLGEDTVYVFWRFRSDANNVRNIGTFIDNISISWDDGLQDLAATSLELVKPDSDLVIYDPQIGQSIGAHFLWNICDGAVETYDPYHVIMTVNNVTIMDTLMTESHANDMFEMYSPLWEITAPGDYTVRLVVDTLNQIPENNENNNVRTVTYHVVPLNPPPQFTWVAPGNDTLRGDSSVTLRWIVTDPDEQATVSVYQDNEASGCLGTQVPGGMNRPELDGPDSLVWTTRFLPDGRILYVFAHVWDSTNDTCIYAAYPVKVVHPNAVSDHPPGAIPEAFFVEQNYPNPFNPVTDIHYGIAVPGEVSLKVFNVLGREVAELVSERRDAGSYVATFDGTTLPTGLYMYVLAAPEGTLGRKMMLLK